MAIPATPCRRHTQLRQRSHQEVTTTAMRAISAITACGFVDDGVVSNAVRRRVRFSWRVAHGAPYRWRFAARRPSFRRGSTTTAAAHRGLRGSLSRRMASAARRSRHAAFQPARRPASRARRRGRMSFKAGEGLGPFSHSRTSSKHPSRASTSSPAPLQYDRGARPRSTPITTKYCSATPRTSRPRRTRARRRRRSDQPKFTWSLMAPFGEAERAKRHLQPQVSRS